MFINDDFLLDTPQARTLFHEYAEGQPIIDYHSHLDPAAIADNRQFSNIAQLWLDGDHYKWRAMRTNGIPERLCSGDAPDREKYDAWAATVPRLLRNPLYHWTHLELRRPFGISGILFSPETADEVWEKTSSMLQSGGMGALDILKRMNVETVCTTDDPCDDLSAHPEACLFRGFRQTAPHLPPGQGARRPPGQCVAGVGGAPGTGIRHGNP